MTPEQSRAARGWLGWSQSDLAERARVAKNTVHGFESGQRTLTRNNIAALQHAIEAEGIQLLFDEAGAAAGIMRKNARVAFTTDEATRLTKTSGEK
jgi:ribosome-binding protein aMBF1 (putative translation factor)